MQETSLYKSSRRVGLLGSDSRTPFGDSHEFHWQSLQPQRIQCAGLFVGTEPNSRINDYTVLQHRKYLYEDLKPPGLR